MEARYGPENIGQTKRHTTGEQRQENISRIIYLKPFQLAPKLLLFM